MEGQSDGKRRITIREAATLLGVHPNTVRSRIKDGSIEAEKVITERGPTWMIDPDSLTTNTPTSGSQQLDGRVPQEALTLLAREIVREAGLVSDPEQVAAEQAHQQFVEGGREHWKAQIDFFKHMATVSGAALVAVAALTNTLQLESITGLLSLLIAGVSFLSCAIAALINLLWASQRLVRFSWGDVPAREEAGERLTSSFTQNRGVTYMLFGIGLSALLTAVIAGWPPLPFG